MLLGWLLAVLPLAPAVAQDDGLFALARLEPERSEIRDRRGGFDLVLTLSQPVPYRVATLTDPPRLVLDFREVDFAPLHGRQLGYSAAVGAVRYGKIQNGWSRMVIDLAGPFAVESAAMETGASDGSARIEAKLREVEPAVFEARSKPQGGLVDLDDRPDGAPVAADDGILTVVLDPGHGGIDPGAVRDGREEADLVLTFARELRDALRREEGIEVAMTRDADVFVSLESRIDAARRAGADVFVSLHADAVAEGVARGAQVYTLADEASSAASRKLAERHDRADLLAGVDLSDQDDQVARVLMSIARTETAPRTEALAQAILDGFRDKGVKLHKRPHEAAAFSVLKAPDIPSVLIELGFMSDADELAKLQDPVWRALAVSALAEAIGAWNVEDRAKAALRRQ